MLPREEAVLQRRREEFERQVREESRQRQQVAERSIVGRNIVEQGLFASRVLGWISSPTHFLRTDLLLDSLLNAIGSAEGLLSPTVLYDSDKDPRGTSMSLAAQAFVARPNVAVLSFAQDHTVYGFFVKTPFPADKDYAYVYPTSFSFVASMDTEAGTLFRAYPSRRNSNTHVTIHNDWFVYSGSGDSGPNYVEEITLEIPSRSDRQAGLAVVTYEWDTRLDDWDVADIKRTVYTSVRILVVQFSQTSDTALEHIDATPHAVAN